MMIGSGSAAVVPNTHTGWRRPEWDCCCCCSWSGMWTVAQGRSHFIDHTLTIGCSTGCGCWWGRREQENRGGLARMGRQKYGTGKTHRDRVLSKLVVRRGVESRVKCFSLRCKKQLHLEGGLAVTVTGCWMLCGSARKETEMRKASFPFSRAEGTQYEEGESHPASTSIIKT